MEVIGEQGARLLLLQSSQLRERALDVYHMHRLAALAAVRNRGQIGTIGLNDDAIGGYPAAGDSYTTFPVREFWNEVTLVDAVVSDPSHDVIMSGHPDGMQYVVRIT